MCSNLRLILFIWKYEQSNTETRKKKKRYVRKTPVSSQTHVRRAMWHCDTSDAKYHCRKLVGLLPPPPNQQSEKRPSVNYRNSVTDWARWQPGQCLLKGEAADPARRTTCARPQPGSNKRWRQCSLHPESSWLVPEHSGELGHTKTGAADLGQPGKVRGRRTQMSAPAFLKALLDCQLRLHQHLLGGLQRQQRFSVVAWANY